jgi:uncharacterized protein YerC
MTKKERFLEKAKNYAEDGKLNLSLLRQVDLSLYNGICFYFDGIKDFKEAIKPVECVYEKSKYKKKPDDIVKVNFETKTLRNLFAHDHINILRQTMTYEQIATKYGVTKQAVQRLDQSLSRIYG